jgi:hypothetical protein
MKPDKFVGAIAIAGEENRYENEQDDAAHRLLSKFISSQSRRIRDLTQYSITPSLQLLSRQRILTNHV